MNILLAFIPLVLTIGIFAGIIYVIYRMVDGWVNKSLSVREEQNRLLLRLIETISKEKN